MSRHPGFGVLNFLNDLPLTRFLRILEPYAVVFAIAGLLSQCDDMKAERDSRAWQVITTPASGNSGKIEALEYLNSHYPLTIPNPRQWGIPIGPVATSGRKPPAEWVVVANWGWWKTRTPLVGLDLSRKQSVDGKSSSGVYLAGIDLSDADLSDADFSGANLSDANLAHTNLTNAKFQDSSLRDATLASADLTAADLSGASLIAANLSGAYLGAKIENPGHGSSKVINAVNLSGADLRYADFSGAHLVLANLWGADLRGAKLAKALDLAQLQINETCTDKSTTLPDGIKAPPPCEVNTLLDALVRDEKGTPVRVK